MVCVERLRENDDAFITQVAELEADIFSDPWSRKEIENTIRNKQTFCAVAKEEGKVLGYFLCYYVLEECEIARIAVDPKMRRRGVGQSLFSYMLQLCQEKQIQKILLDVRESNLPAITFYKKQGFLVDGIRKHFYGGKQPENAVLMSKDLMEDFA